MTIYLSFFCSGDLLAIGKIRSLETGLIFNNPSAWAIYCKKIINPAKKSGCGWASVKYKGRKMDYFKNVWLKRKAQRDAEVAKNEAAQALTALSAGLARPEERRENVVRTASVGPGLAPSHSPHFLELDNWTLDGRMQPFTISVATSAMLVLDLHSHLSTDSVCGYLAGHWDSNSHNLAITSTFPCLLPPGQSGTLAAQSLETSIYEDLYGKHLSLVGWYHSNPRGPPAPSVKDCQDQLDFQIKLLGSNDSYTPCVGLICSPYDKESKTTESSIIFYWVYPPGENSSQEMGKPMRMSYSVIQDPCLSEEVIQQIDKVVSFCKSQPEESQVKLVEPYEDNLYYIDKIGRSLLSKFPQDQDEKLWLYIQSSLLQGLDVKNFVSNIGLQGANSDPVNGRKISEEEEIDDDEETALNEQEIDDDEETAIVESLSSQPTLTISQFSPMMGTHMTFTRTNTAAGQEVNLSIRETDDMQDIEFPQVRDEEEQPLELTVNGKEEDSNKPLNFSNQNDPSQNDDVDSDDDERLVIKE